MSKLAFVAREFKKHSDVEKIKLNLDHRNYVVLEFDLKRHPDFHFKFVNQASAIDRYINPNSTLYALIGGSWRKIAVYPTKEITVQKTQNDIDRVFSEIGKRW